MKLSSVEFLGQGLVRPECVLAHSSGLVFCSDSRGNGGISIVRENGETTRIEARDVSRPLHPNGIALLKGGEFLLAHLGADDGGVFKLSPDGGVEPYLVELGGTPLPPTNFVYHDAEDRVWICVSTSLRPRSLAYRSTADDGYIILVDKRGARVVAEGLGYTNECVIDRSRGYLYVNETFGRRISRFQIGQDGGLSGRKIVAEFGAGTFPDGLTLDADGGLWLTGVVSNHLIHIEADGTQTIVLEDFDADYVQRIEKTFVENNMAVADIAAMPPSTLKNLSCLAFSGPDLRTGLLGSLDNDRLAVLAMPVAGQEPPHWRYDLGDLAATV